MSTLDKNGHSWADQYFHQRWRYFDFYTSPQYDYWWITWSVLEGRGGEGGKEGEGKGKGGGEGEGGRDWEVMDIHTTSVPFIMNEQFLSIFQPTDTLSLVNIIHIHRLYNHFHKIVVEIFRPNLLPKKKLITTRLWIICRYYIMLLIKAISIIFTQYKHLKNVLQMILHLHSLISIKCYFFESSL